MKASKWLLIILIAIPLIAVGIIYVGNKAVGPVGWAKDDTIKELKTLMKDPESMVIRSSYTIIRPDEKGFKDIYICGVVDAKNSFGGYTGGMRFVSQSFASERSFNFISATVEDPEATRAARKLGVLSGFEKLYWNQYCVDAEHPEISVTPS